MENSKQESQYARSLIEASHDPLITISTEGKITDMNDALMSITGMTREQLTGTFFYTYFTEPQKARDVYEDVFANGSVADHLLTIRNAELTEVLFNGSTYKDENGMVMGAVVVARDVTEQKRIESELIEARTFAELATVFAEDAKQKAESATQIAKDATVTAENAMRAAEDAVKSKQQFLSNMSHEIRTPMNAILGFTKVLLKTPLSFKQREYLDAIKASGDALIVLINDILDLAKVDSGKMSFEYVPFKLSQSISSMLQLFQPKIEEKNLRLVKHYDERIPKVLEGDPVRLHQIIMNLISNAVKFTSEGEIVVSINMLEEDDEKVSIEFSIADTGIGIPENRLASIFENFQQAHSSTSRIYGGTGLGLAIVKQLVEPQGGSINVVSTPDKGSTFSFILDFQKTKASGEAEQELALPEVFVENISVLVVEDIALNQLLMQTLLDDFGFTCEIAENGKIAIDKLALKTYDIILMDLQMPELNGFQATEYIRNTLKLTTPIIALTADVTTVDLAKCKEVGMNDYIAKPADEKLLFSKIMGLVKTTDAETSRSTPTHHTHKRCINLDFLRDKTKSRPELMMKMIRLYIEQTPPLVATMKESMRDKNWKTLRSAAHKMIPSFSIVGIKKDYEIMAKRIQDFNGNRAQQGNIEAMIEQLEVICEQACLELEEEYTTMKTADYV